MRHLLTQQLASSQQQLLRKAAWENLSSLACFKVVAVFWMVVTSTKARFHILVVFTRRRAVLDCKDESSQGRVRLKDN